MTTCHAYSKTASAVESRQERDLKHSGQGDGRLHSVKCLLCKHRDPRSSPSHHGKDGYIGVHLKLRHWGGGVDPEDCQQLAEKGNSRFINTLSQNLGAEQLKKMPDADLNDL